MYELLRQLCQRDNRERGDLIISYIKGIGINPDIQDFNGFGEKYRNISVRLRQGNPNDSIAYSAHYDKIHCKDTPLLTTTEPDEFKKKGKSQGANDNGAAVVELIGTLEELIKSPPSDIDLTFLFFDGEEELLAGSGYYVANTNPQFDGIYNVELGGIGDALLIGKYSCLLGSPFSCYPTSDDLNSNIEDICKLLQIPYHNTFIGASDHSSFLKLSLPATIITATQKPNNNIDLEWIKNKDKIFDMMHTAKDTFDKIDPKTLDMMKCFLLALTAKYFN